MKKSSDDPLTIGILLFFILLALGWTIHKQAQEMKEEKEECKYCHRIYEKK